MKDFFLKIYDDNEQIAVSDILDTYEEKGYAWINFMYFAYIKSQKLYLTKIIAHHYKSKFRAKLKKKLKKRFNDFDVNTLYSKKFPDKQKMLIGKLANNRYSDYHDALINADFLFADGIALQISYFFLKLFKKIPNVGNKKYRPANLNGTDFLPYFFSELINKYGSHKINVILYGSYPDYVKKTEDYFKRKGIHVLYYQDGYSELDRGEVSHCIDKYQDKINILLIARSSPDIPIQELRVHNNLENIKKYKLITFTVGGLFDHFIGVQKRAPKFLIWIKLERLWRLITHPKRNYKKILNIFSGFKYIFYYLLLKKH